MEDTYTKINKNSLKGEILINSRKDYIHLISKDFLENKIIPIEYIDNKIHLNNINKGNKGNKGNKNIIIDDILRLKFIIELLNKECIKGTSRLISDICSK